MFGWGKKSNESIDDELRKAGKGPYSLPPEDNGDPRAVYVEHADRKYRLSSLQDCIRFRDNALSDEGWAERHREPKIVVQDRPAPAGALGEGMNLIKITNCFPNVAPSVLYDSLHDPVFRKSWDSNMIEGFNITLLDARNDIGYYSANLPWPLQNREFLNMRCWMEFTNGEYLIFNRSVVHNDYPVTSKYVRALSYVSGYYISPLPNSTTGCRMIYLTHGNMEGSIPHAIMNFAYTKGAPSMMAKLEANAERYKDWKREQGRDDNYVPPWRTPPMSWDPAENAAAGSGKAAAALPKSEEGSASSLLAGSAAAAAGGAAGAASGSGGGSASGAAAAAAGDDAGGKSLDDTLRQLAGTDGGGNNNSAGSGETAVLRAKLEEMKKKLRAAEAQSLLSGDGSSLAPAAARRDDDPESVQQFRAMLDDCLCFVDRQYVHEGRAPTVSEYLLRLHSVVDGLRRTLREEKVPAMADKNHQIK